MATTRDRLRNGLLWSLVYVVNLPAPLFYGWGFTAEGGRRGMVVALPILWLLGLLATRHDRVRRWLLVGGCGVAFSQVFPILHMGAGLGGFLVWSWLNEAVGNAPSSQLSEFGGGVVTCVTGGLLALVALLLGAGLVALAGEPSPLARESSN